MSKRLLLLTLPMALLLLASSVVVTPLLRAGIHAAPTAAAPHRPAEIPPAQPACVATLSCEGDGPIVALGDSTTYGYGQGVTRGGYGQGVPMSADGPIVRGSYPWDLERLLGVPVVNGGMSGDTAYTALHPPARGNRYRPAGMRIPALLARHPRLVIVSFGAADAAYGVPLARAAADLDALLDALGGIPTVIVGSHTDCTTMTVCVDPQAVFTSDWDVDLRVLATRHHAGLVLNVFEGLAEAGEMTDSMHPNVRGYTVVASRIAAAVRQRLTPPWVDGGGSGSVPS